MKNQILRRVVLFFIMIGLPVIVFGQESTNDPHIIVVSGATGTQGGAVARSLLDRGFIVRGLTRNPNSEASIALSELGAHMVQVILITLSHLIQH